MTPAEKRALAALRRWATLFFCERGRFWRAERALFRAARALEKGKKVKK